MVGGNTLYGRSHQQTAASERDFRPLCGGVACLDFVNTVDRHGSTPDDDYFAPGYANLLDWFEYAQLVDSDNATLLLRLAQKQPRDAAAIRKRAQFLRTAIRGIVVDLASGGTPSPGDLATLNAEVHRACACGSFVAVDQVLQWRWTRNRELDSLLWPIARSAAELLSGAHLVRVRQCAAEECELLFLDASKNGSRRFCSAASCGNATRVRRFRAHRETKAATGA
jgi:predicted RNA-binding Zn ribbon-like protein